MLVIVLVLVRVLLLVLLLVLVLLLLLVLLDLLELMGVPAGSTSFAAVAAALVLPVQLLDLN